MDYFSLFIVDLYRSDTLNTGLDILLGKYDNDDDPGDINHFQALSAALAGTVGMGNIQWCSRGNSYGWSRCTFWMWFQPL